LTPDWFVPRLASEFLGETNGDEDVRLRILRFSTIG
jgi:hypothetical protein